MPKTKEDYRYIASLFNADNVVFYETKIMSDKAVEQMIKSKRRKDYIISDSEIKVGWCNFRWNASIDEATLGVIIDKPFWRKGYGIQAIEYIENKIKSLGINKIQIKVFEHNTAALELYKKLGYREGAERIISLQKEIK